MSVLSKKHEFDMVFDSQAVFRLVLEALSNPGRTVSLKEYAKKLHGDYPALLALAMTLLDNEVCFNVRGSSSLSEEIAGYTLAAAGNLDAADFVFCCSPHQENEMENILATVKCGTLSDPHKSATVIVCDEGTHFSPLVLSGPGINGRAEISASQTIKNAITLRDAQNYEYPQGIDLIFINNSGELRAIPRLVRSVA